MNCSRMSPLAKSEASSIMALVLLSRKFWVKMQVFSISLFLYFSSFIFSFNILQSFLPSIFPLPLPPFSFLPFFIKFPTIFPPLSKLTLFIVSMLINYTKTNNPSEFQIIGNLPFNIAPCFQNNWTFSKNLSGITE